MCDRRILSSDPHDWDELISEAAGAEKYSRRLSERITDGYAAKFDRRDDPGGHAGPWLPALREPPHTLEVDPDTIGVGGRPVRALRPRQRERQGPRRGDRARRERIRMILMNPIYNGWIRRHRRSASETRKPAPWRGEPAGLRRAVGAGRGRAPVKDPRRRAEARRGRVDLLKGLLECVCGRRVRSDGTFADGRHRKLHANPCAEWGKRARLGDETWEEPILAQLEGIELDDGTIAAVVASLGSGAAPGRD